MKSLRVLRAAAFRALKPRLFDPVFPLELVEFVKERYDFKQVPTVQELASGPANFMLGKLTAGEHSITVEQLSVVYVGMQATSVSVATRTSTDDAELFLNDLIHRIADGYGLDSGEVFPRAYHSQVEFAFERSLAGQFEELVRIGHEITEFIKGYGKEDCPEFEFGGFSMHFDTTKPQSMPIPTPFAVERRVGAPYEENKYFSQGPLKTKHHVDVLRLLEEIFVHPPSTSSRGR